MEIVLNKAAIEVFMHKIKRDKLIDKNYVISLLNDLLERYQHQELLCVEKSHKVLDEINLSTRKTAEMICESLILNIREEDFGNRGTEIKTIIRDWGYNIDKTLCDKLLNKLVDDGYCDRNYKWLKTQPLAAYAANYIMTHTNYGRWEDFQELFGIKSTSKLRNVYSNRVKEPSDKIKKEIKKLETCLSR